MIAVSQQLHQAVDELLGALEVHVVARDAVDVHLRRSIVDGRDDRQAVAHGLDVRDAEAFAATRHREHAGARPQRVELRFGHETRELDALTGR
jgi:hypothetical protein